MQIKTILLSTLITFTAASVKAQTEIPAGYTKGSVTLANGTVVTGFVKDNIKKSTSVGFLDNAGTGKKTYEGSNINGVTIDDVNYVCINGDFFKSLSAGKLNFLQKASNASGKVSYNGTVAIINNGTEGKIGDYFIYAANNLKLINKKTVESFINTDLTGCMAAIEKAKTINGDIARLKEAVEIYNKTN